MNKGTLMKESFCEWMAEKPPIWFWELQPSPIGPWKLLEFKTELDSDSKRNSQKIDHNYLIADYQLLLEKSQGLCHLRKGQCTVS